MPLPASKQYKFDTTGEKIPSSNVKRKSEGRASIGSASPVAPDRMNMPKSSESVGVDSLPGHVQRNKGKFEQTEGRL